ncbi:Crp/Fnr family transcriptional regulator [Brevibacillus panacihumi]|uniref:Crp/Fnr family transcriptional regulator n=1 Tax=Brevibacillus panacihumi TaxID=497735 RepID=UPI001FEB8F17|nr:Crp/Fnr family transcriptional regulator [Brevibacillus panacihumi]
MQEHRSALKNAEVIVVPRQSLFQTPEVHRSGVYVIMKGILRFYRLKEDGKMFTVELLGEGDVFGHVDSLSFGTTRGIYIEALQDTILKIWGSSDHASNDFQHSPFVLRQMLARMAERLENLEQRMESLALDSVRERVLLLLVQMCSRFGYQEGTYWRLSIPLSHQEIANMVGSSRETVSATLSQLAKEKLLLASRLSIRLHSSVMAPAHRH